MPAAIILITFSINRGGCKPDFGVIVGLRQL
jgi:hypothetical protein